MRSPLDSSLFFSQGSIGVLMVGLGALFLTSFLHIFISGVLSPHGLLQNSAYHDLSSSTYQYDHPRDTGPFYSSWMGSAESQESAGSLTMLDLNTDAGDEVQSAAAQDALAFSIKSLKDQTRLQITSAVSSSVSQAWKARAIDDYELQGGIQLFYDSSGLFEIKKKRKKQTGLGKWRSRRGDDSSQYTQYGTVPPSRLLFCRIYGACRMFDGSLVLPQWMKTYHTELTLCGLSSKVIYNIAQYGGYQYSLAKLVRGRPYSLMDYYINPMPDVSDDSYLPFILKTLMSSFVMSTADTVRSQRFHIRSACVRKLDGYCPPGVFLAAARSTISRIYSMARWIPWLARFFEDPHFSLAFDSAVAVAPLFVAPRFKRYSCQTSDNRSVSQWGSDVCDFATRSMTPRAFTVLNEDTLESRFSANSAICFRSLVSFSDSGTEKHLYGGNVLAEDHPFYSSTGLRRENRLKAQRSKERGVCQLNLLMMTAPLTEQELSKSRKDAAVLFGKLTGVSVEHRNSSSVSPASERATQQAQFMARKDTHKPLDIQIIAQYLYVAQFGSQLLINFTFMEPFASLESKIEMVQKADVIFGSSDGDLDAIIYARQGVDVIHAIPFGDVHAKRNDLLGRLVGVQYLPVMGKLDVTRYFTCLEDKNPRKPEVFRYLSQLKVMAEQFYPRYSSEEKETRKEIAMKRFTLADVTDVAPEDIVGITECSRGYTPTFYHTVLASVVLDAIADQCVMSRADLLIT